ncbi:oxygenase MpaB family protein [Actinomadura parmotrematis]|uniref:Oxygenase MpaB family protein n=1 Tax=Actinomadura parmotrematis TaxID=2864039 RepID=A0ABS7FVF6_9ACTN|nr:oxygenase MpaB family protein [Actinomadura parmotrematis]MBW8484417.1 oxygenase MpaB family protein [Actinomadura parmotrematis]
MSPAPVHDDPADVLGPHALLASYCDDARWGLAVVRATVLEAAHPQIGAALIDNSTFVTHPWRRLRNTLLSTRRIMDADPDVRDREAARLNRLHARISGTDEAGRPYSALDAGARAWVVATLFESTVTLARLSGESLDGPSMERLYGEFRAFLALLEGNADALPPTVPEFWPYYDGMLARGLENTEAIRVILYKLFAHVPAPPVLRGRPAVWAVGRAVGGPAAAMVVVATLPESFRRQAGLADLPGAGALSRGLHLGTGVATRLLPKAWTRTGTVMGLLDPEGEELPAVLEALRGRTGQAAALIRLLTPDRADAGPRAGDGPAARSADRFFAEVLDQTGNGTLDWPDLASMAREIAGRLDLDAADEERLYDAYARWWRELLADLDADGDGRITRGEYAAAASSLAGPALIRLAEVLFATADTDGDGDISAAEHRALFRTAFGRDLDGRPDGEDARARCSRADFVRDFVAFMSGQRSSTAYDALLVQA